LSPNGVTIPPYKILFTGLRKSGKTSAHAVVFQSLPPKQSFYLEPTVRLAKSVVDSIISLEIWDCSLSGSVDSLEVSLKQFSSLVYFIDIQDSFHQSIAKLTNLVMKAIVERPDINLEVFVHKVESMPEEYRAETFRMIQNRVADELDDAGVDSQGVLINYHLTSIFDHTIWEAFSRVIQRLIEPAQFLEDCLNLFCANSQISKAFLFDLSSRIYVATDSAPVDRFTHTLAWDYLTLLRQFEPLYKTPSANPPKETLTAWTTGSIRLNPHTTLAFWQITNALGVVAMLPSETFHHRRGLVEYNLVFFRDGVRDGCEILSRRREVEPCLPT